MKKQIAILFVLALLVSLLGCGGKPAPSGTAASTAAGTGTETAAGTAEATAAGTAARTGANGMWR